MKACVLFHMGRIKHQKKTQSVNKTTPFFSIGPGLAVRALKFGAGLLGILAALAACLALAVGIAFALAYSNLPDI